MIQICIRGSETISDDVDVSFCFAFLFSCILQQHNPAEWSITENSWERVFFAYIFMCYVPIPLWAHSQVQCGLENFFSFLGSICVFLHFETLSIDRIKDKRVERKKEKKKEKKKNISRVFGSWSCQPTWEEKRRWKIILKEKKIERKKKQQSIVCRARLSRLAALSCRHPHNAFVAAFYQQIAGYETIQQAARPSCVSH